MFQEYTPQISEYLANAMKVHPSEIKVKERDVDPLRFLFFLNGQIVAWSGSIILGQIVPPVFFQLPASDAGKSYDHFSMSHIDDFEISAAFFTYHIDKHPEFTEVLKDLMVNYRIPRQKIYSASEPSVSRRDGLEGVIVYYLGTSPNQHLCIQVEPEDVKYVPEADKQTEQRHHCIPGEDAPVNPFSINPKTNFLNNLLGHIRQSDKKLSVVRIGLQGEYDPPYGRKYLKEILEGLPVPADGLELEGEHNGQYGNIKLRTPYNPFIQINLHDPLSEENWEKKVALARSLEAMFK